MGRYVAIGTVSMGTASGVVLAAIVNPIGSGKNIIVYALAPAKAGTQELPASMVVERYSTEIAAVSVTPAAAPVTYKCDPSSANSVALVYTTASHTFTEPNAGNKTFELPLVVVDALRARDSGFTVTIPPGSSGVLECDQDGGNVPAVFVVSWDEVAV